MSVTTYNWFINSQEEESWAYRPTLSREQCADVIKHGLSLQLEDAIVGNDAIHNTAVRNSRVSWIPSNNPETQWIFRLCTDMINDLNERYFKYDLLYIENLQFTEYDGSNPNPAFYCKHVDTVFRNSGSRKLSFSILLSDETSFDGGDLMLHTSKDPVPGIREQGVAITFPSHVLHEVTPVTKGTRYSLVGWVVGPRLR
jgi:PKHD-type hydroxylase